MKKQGRVLSHPAHPMIHCWRVNMQIVPEEAPQSIHEKIVGEYRIRYLAGDDFVDDLALEVVAEMLIEREIYETGT